MGKTRISRVPVDSQKEAVMRITILKENMTEVTREGMSVVTHAYRQGNKIVMATYHESGKVSFKYTQDRPGEWLILKGAGEFHWHKPDVSRLRDETYEAGRMPPKTLRVKGYGQTWKELLNKEFNFKVHWSDDMCINDAHVTINDKNISLEAEMLPGEYMIAIPGFDGQRGTTFNRSGCKINYPIYRIVIVG